MKNRILALVLTLVLALPALCGAAEKIVIGVTPFPHGEIAKKMKPLLEKEGFILEIKDFTDYIQPNMALAEKSLNANFFQHIPYLENMNVCVGPVTEDMLPADANADNTVCIGVCCKKLADAKGFRWVVGCPPGNADVVKGILGDRKEYGVRYE